MYELLDSGLGAKLEKFGGFILSRPDPQAIWKKNSSEWAADAIFNDGKWHFKKELPESWEVEIESIKFKIGLSNFKHTGVFPEHADNWKWVEEKLKENSEPKRLSVLNLFGYTGGYTLAAAKAGAEVVHMDSSKFSVSRAKENAELNNLEQVNIRYIVDDAMAFLKREVKRESKYDGIILDPPSFGRGVKGEVWKIEEDLLPLLELCKQVLSPNPKFILLNGYASGFSITSYSQLLSSVFDIPLSKVEFGDLSIQESTPRAFSLPAGIFARISF